MSEETRSILSRLSPPKGSKKKGKRKGRGPGSGLGKTAGRGQKGQKARRSGGLEKRAFEGGQMPLSRRLPKVGFVNFNAKKVKIVKVERLNEFPDGAIVDVNALRERGIIKGKFDAVKLIGNGELKKSLIVRLHAFSAGAREAVEKAGGKCEPVA
ncbi:MAG: 50S ribosomal protein L15 [Sandaracinaceae bacterium]|nr:50S ribosomal protein L15 [Sandaracinaceae bacterium]